MATQSPNRRLLPLAAGLLITGGILYLFWPGALDAAGVNLSVEPPTVDAAFLKDVLSKKTALPPRHPFHGRTLMILDLRGPLPYRDRFLPGAIPAHATQAFGRQIQATLADEEAAVVLFGDPKKEQAILDYRRRRVFVLATGWEAALEQRTLPAGRTPAASAAARKQPQDPLAPPHREHPPEMFISAGELQARLRAKEPFDLVFVGPEEQFLERRIEGAIHVPIPALDEFLRQARPEREIVFYCGCCTGRTSGFSGMAVERALHMGFKSVRHLEGHLKGWIRSGHPVISGPPATAHDK